MRKKPETLVFANIIASKSKGYVDKTKTKEQKKLETKTEEKLQKIRFDKNKIFLLKLTEQESFPNKFVIRKEKHNQFTRKMEKISFNSECKGKHKNSIDCEP